MKKLLLTIFCIFSLVVRLSGEMVGVYWGAFDPPTEAHKAIIEAALNEIPLEKVIVVVNNNKYKNYTFSLEDRIRLVRQMINVTDKVDIMWQDDSHKIDYAFLKKNVGDPLCAIAGYDSYLSWINYSSVSDRNQYACIAVVPRGDEKPILFDSNAFILRIDECYKHLSSTKIRELLKTTR